MVWAIRKKIPREFSPLPGVAVVYRLKAVGGIAPLAAIFRLYLRIRSHIRQAVLYVTPNCRWTSSAATPFRDVVKRNINEKTSYAAACGCSQMAFRQSDKT